MFQGFHKFLYVCAITLIIFITFGNELLQKFMKSDGGAKNMSKKQTRVGESFLSFFAYFFKYRNQS